MTDNKLIYAAVQNGVILDMFDTEEKARERVEEEIKKDWLSILFKSSVRKLLKKTGDVALHKYSIITILKAEEIK